MIKDINYNIVRPGEFFITYKNGLSFGYHLLDNNLRLPEKEGEGRYAKKSIVVNNKDEVREHIINVSKAYVFAHEKHQQLLKDDASKNDLEKQFKLILAIRDVLKFLVTYEEDYSRMKEKYNVT